MKKIQITGLMMTLCLLSLNAQAQLSLPSIFTDHMVLQQNGDVPIWGWAEANATIKIVGSWAPQDTASVVVKSDGAWSTTLRTASAGGPYTVSISGNGQLEFNDVMLGEVWLCSGQSNMEWTPMKNIDNAEVEIANANHPNIRFFHIPRRGANTPQNQCEANWAVCTPDVMKRTSAVGYFFGRKLQEDLNVPIGLIVAAWGGTPAEVWIPAEAVTSNPILDAAKPQKEYPWWPIEPGVLYNQIIHPIIPYSIAGSIWYQGEANHEEANTYGLLMQTLIESWRQDFGKDFSFYLVQIAPYTYNSTDNGPALLRERQEWVSRNVPGTGLVVVSDLVNDVNDIHPTDKQNVGLRLANQALAKTYNRLTSGYESPVFHNLEINKNKAIISFLHAESGLMCKDKQPSGFSIAGEDGNFVPAKAKIKDNTIIVSSSKVKNPTVVRYCFDDATLGNVFSKEGLPVAPFRTDRDW